MRPSNHLGEIDILHFNIRRDRLWLANHGNWGGGLGLRYLLELDRNGEHIAEMLEPSWDASACSRGRLRIRPGSHVLEVVALRLHGKFDRLDRYPLNRPIVDGAFARAAGEVDAGRFQERDQVDRADQPPANAGFPQLPTGRRVGDFDASERQIQVDARGGRLEVELAVRSDSSLEGLAFNILQGHESVTNRYLSRCSLDVEIERRAAHRRPQQIDPGFQMDRMMRVRRALERGLDLDLAGGKDVFPNLARNKGY